MADRPVAAGVVGVGSMGRNHARVYADLADVDLVGVSDADAERAASVADDLGTRAFDLDALLERADAVSVVVPTPVHHELASACVDAGVHALVEKPFVADPARGRDLAARARDAGVALQVGHVERFNPVVDTVASTVANEDLVSLRADRLGPPAGRDIPDSVVTDLMIHDLDVVLELAGGRPTDVSATATADGEYAVATLAFDSGLVATLSASRVSHEPVRELAVTTDDRALLADYADQSVSVTRSDAGTDSLEVDAAEPLARELRSFADAAATGRSPVVDAGDGLRAVEVAREIEVRAGLTDAEPLPERTPVDGA